MWRYLHQKSSNEFISSNRLKNFVLDKTLEKCSHTLPNGKRLEVYRITNEGKQWIRANIDSLADRKYYSSTGVQHDIQLMDKILSLSREERSTMRCESEIRDDFKERLQELLLNRDYDRYDTLYNAMQSHSVSMPDLSYGVDEYYEVITNSYREAEIQAKIEAVEAIGGNLQMDRI